MIEIDWYKVLNRLIHGRHPDGARILDCQFVNTDHVWGVWWLANRTDRTQCKWAEAFNRIVPYQQLPLGVQPPVAWPNHLYGARYEDMEIHRHQAWYDWFHAQEIPEECTKETFPWPPNGCDWLGTNGRRGARENWERHQDHTTERTEQWTDR